MRTLVSTLAAVALAASVTAQPKLKVIVDQDARGPCTTDIQAILMFVQSPDVEVLGITVVSGDLWLEQEVRHTLRALELAGRTDIPVYRGAVFPLVHTQEEASGWEALYGEQPYQGAWEGELGPYETVPLREGEPSIDSAAAEGHAANFIVDMVNRYPGEVHLWSGGPLTNFALALALDPTLPEKVKALTVMGGGIDAARYRREFNWWWDPEAARIVLRAPWKQLMITPVDIAVKTHHSEELVARIAGAGTPLARYIDEFHVPQPVGGNAEWTPGVYMWDEVSAASVLDPSIITSSREMYVDVDIDHGIHYGFTLAWELDQHQTPSVPISTVQFDLDTERFYDLYVELMTRP
ncbi:MAG: nucleoside hydrolase [Acidobacteriota bacterium]|nr:MAG: nucleoside hydrolase [Acidobacteriota bacterium]